MSMVAAREINKLLVNNKICVITPATPYASHLEEIDKISFKNYWCWNGRATCSWILLWVSFAGLKPILCIQSTFLQRAYDQLIHDVSYMSSDVLILSSRSGFSGLTLQLIMVYLIYLTWIQCHLQIYYPNSEKQQINFKIKNFKIK